MKKLFIKFGIVFTFIACLFTSNVLFRSNNSFATFADEVIISQSFEGVEGLWEDTVSNANNTNTYDDAITEISTAEELATFAKEVNNGNSYQGKTVALTADIDLAGKFWTPIGNSRYSFEGTFEGNGYTIFNLNISCDMISATHYGLFGYVGSYDVRAKINNLILKGFNIKSNVYAGALTGYNFKGYISNIAVESGIITTTKGNLGGVVGIQDSQDSVIEKCYVSNNVTLSNSGTSETGIIVGRNDGATVRNCYGWNDQNYSVVGKGTKGTNVYSYNTNTRALVEINDLNNNGEEEVFDLYKLGQEDEWGILVNNQYVVHNSNVECPVLKGVGNYTINIGNITKNNYSNASFQYAKTIKDTKTNFTNSLIVPLESSYEIFVVPEKGSTLAKYSIDGNDVEKSLQEQTSSSEQAISLQSSGSKIDGLNTNRQKIVNLDVIIDKRTIRLDSTKFIPYDFYNEGDGIVETKPNATYYGLNVNQDYNHQEITADDFANIANISKEFKNVEELNGVYYARADQVFYVDVRVDTQPFSSLSTYKPVNYEDVFDYITSEINKGIICSLPTETSQYDRFAITFSSDYAGISSGSDYIPLAYTSQYVAELKHGKIANILQDVENQTYYTNKTFYAYISKHNSTLTTTNDYFEKVINPKGYIFDGYYKYDKEADSSIRKIKASTTTSPYEFNFINNTYTNYANETTVVYEARWTQRNYTYELTLNHNIEKDCTDSLENMGLVIYNKTQEKLYSYNSVSKTVNDSNLHVGDEILIFNTNRNSNIERTFSYLGAESNFKITNHSIIEYDGTLYDAISVLMVSDHVKKNSIIMEHKLEINSKVTTNVNYAFEAVIPSLSTEDNITHANIEEASKDGIKTLYGNFTIRPYIYANGTYTIIDDLSLINFTGISSDGSTAYFNMPYGYKPLIVFNLKTGVNLTYAKYRYSIYNDSKLVSSENLNINSFVYEGNSIFNGVTCYPVLLDSLSGEQVYSTVNITFAVDPQEIYYLVNIYLDNEIASDDLHLNAFKFSGPYDYHLASDAAIVVVSSSTFSSNKIIAYKEYTMTIDSRYTFVKNGVDFDLSMYEVDKVSGVEYVKDSTFKFKTSSSTSKTIDIYLKRKYIDVNFETVKLNDANGSISTESTSILINDSIELDGYDIKFSDTDSTVTSSTNTDDYKFVGYFYDQEGTSPAMVGDRLVQDTTIYAVFNLKDVEISISAIWNGNDVTEDIKPYILYNEEKGTTVKVPYGESFKIDVENVNYFNSWNVFLEGDLDTVVSTDQISTGDANFVVIITGFDVTFMSNGGLFDDKTTEKEVANLAVKNLNYAYDSFPSDIIRIGYSFIGWGTSEISGVDIDDTTVVDIENPITTIYAQWKINTYELSYNANGGDSEPSSISVDYGEEVELSDSISRSGYIFSGWESNILNDDEIYEANSTFKMPAGDVIMTAVWTEETYSLVFDENNGEEVEDKSYSYGEDLPTTTRSGYKFVGWCLDEDNDNGSGDGFVKVQDFGDNGASVTLYAKWESQIYEITLNNGITSTDDNLGEVTSTSATTIYVKYGTKDFYEDADCTKLITNFAIWTNDYLSFLGYADSIDATSANYIKYSDKEFEILKNWDKTEDTTLYAVYSNKEYKINFEVKNINNTDFTSLQDSEVYSVSVNTVLDIDAIKENNEKTGFEIIGCKTNRTNYVVSLFGNDTLQITLQYQRNSITISFDSNGGSEVSDKTVYYGLTYGELETPVLRGYSFVGWEYDGVVITSSSIVETSNDHKLVAKWESALYKVTLNANTGTLVNGLETVYASYKTYDFYEDSSAKKSTDNFAVYQKQGYDFLGYALTADASVPDYIEYKENTFEVLKAWDLTEDTTLYAVWQGKEITISFETFGGEELESITAIVGSLYGNLPSASKVGYIFNGWYLSYIDNNGSGTKITASSTIETVNDHTLYANFSVENLYIDFNSTLEKIYDGESIEGELNLFNNSSKTQNDLLTSDYFTNLSYTYEIKKGDISVKTGSITSNTITINNFAKNVSDSGEYTIIVSNSLTSALQNFIVKINKYELDFASEDLSQYLTKEYDTTTEFVSDEITVNNEKFKIVGTLSSADVGNRNLTNITLENVSNFIPNNYSYKNLLIVTVTKKILKINVNLSGSYSTTQHELSKDAEVDGYKVNYNIVIPEKTIVGTYDISDFEIIVQNVATIDNWQELLNNDNFDIIFTGTIEIKSGILTNNELAKILSFENNEVVYDGEYHNLEVQDNGTDYVYSVSYEIYLNNEYQGIQVKNAGKYEVKAIVSVENFENKTIKATLTIKPREIKVVAKESVYSKTYDGTVNTNNDISSSVEIYDILSGNILNDSIVKDYNFNDLDLTAEFASKDCGENIQILFSINSSNYSLTNNQPENKVGKIYKKDLTISLKQTYTAKIFNRQPIGSVEYNKFNYSGLIDGESITTNFNINLVNAGDYDLSSISSLIQNTSSILKNYNISYSGTIKIQQAKITLSTPITTVIYNGEEQEISYSTSAVDGVNINADEMIILYYLNGNQVGNNSADETPKNVGVYTARFIPSENFIILSSSNLVESIDVVYNIETRSAGEISILEQEKVYDGQPFEKIFTSSSVEDLNKCTATNLAANHILTLTVKTTERRAGTYLLESSIESAIITDKDGNDVTTNYTFGLYNGIIRITQQSYVLSSELLTEYAFVYDKTVKTLPENNSVFDEVNTLTNGEFDTEIKYYDASGKETQCVNAGTYRVTVKITANNYTFKTLNTKLVISQRGVYANQNFDKTYDGTSNVTDEITVYDSITNNVLSIDDDVKILGTFVNNYDNKTSISSANDNLKIYLRLDGQDKNNYVLTNYDISAKISKRKTNITVDAEEVYNAQTIKVSYSKMQADNLVDGHNLSGVIDFQTCINVGEYDVSKAGYSLDRFDILHNGLSLKQNYEITLQGVLQILPTTITLAEITDISETKIYDGKLQAVNGFVFANSLTQSCLPKLEDFTVSYLDEELNSKDPISVGKYYVKVTIINENFTFNDGQNNTSSFVYRTSQMEIQKRDLNITTELGQEVFTGSNQYKIILPSILKIVNLVQNQTIQGELTISVNVDSATYNISNFEITKPIQIFLGSEETTSNYNITIGGSLTITKVDIDYSGLENLVYNGQKQVLIIGDYNSVQNPEMFVNIKNDKNQTAEPINAGNYSFDFIDENQNVTPLTFTIQKLNIYGEVDILNKEYDKTSELNKDAKIQIYYYENNDISQNKKYLNELGTSENVVLTGKYMNTSGTVLKTDTGKASIVFEMSGEDTANFNLVNTNISANINKKKIVLNIGNVIKYYDNQKYIFKKSVSNFTNTSEVLCAGDSIPSSATVAYEYYNANETGYNLGENYTFENFGSKFLLLYDVSFSGTLTIKKAEVELKNLTIDNVSTNTSVYNDEEKSLVFEYEIVNGYETDLAFNEVLKVNKDEIFVNTSSALNVGAYRLEISLNEGFAKNYTILNSNYFDFTITQKKINSINIEEQSFVHEYNKTEFEVSNIVNSDLCENHTISLIIITSSDDVGSYTFDEGINGKTVTVLENGEDKTLNYDLSDCEFNGTLVIVKADIVDIELEDETYVFDKQVKTLKGFDDNGNENLKYLLKSKYEDIEPTFEIEINGESEDEISVIDAGTYEIQITVIDNNYNDYVITSTLKIEQKIIYIDKTADFSKTYDGEEFATSELISTIKIKTIENDQEVDLADIYNISFKASYYKESTFTSVQYDVCEKCFVKIEYIYLGDEKASNYKTVDEFIPTAKIAKRNLILTYDETSVYYYIGEDISINVNNFTADNLARQDVLDTEGNVTFNDLKDAGNYTLTNKTFVLNFKILNGSIDKTLNYNISFAGDLTINQAEVVISNLVYSNQDKIYNASLVTFEYDTTAKNGSIVIGELEIGTNITYRSFKEQNEEATSSKEFSSISDIKNAGDYKLEFVITLGSDNYVIVDTNIFDLTISKKLEYVDLSDFKFNKIYGEADNLILDYVTSLNENLLIQLSRDIGEVVGKYDLYLDENYYNDNYEITLLNTTDAFEIISSGDVVQVVLSDESINSFSKIYDGYVVQDIINPTLSYTTYLNNELTSIEVSFEKLVFDKSSSDVGYYKLNMAESVLSSQNYGSITIANFENIFFTINKLGIEIEDNNSFDKVYDGTTNVIVDMSKINIYLYDTTRGNELDDNDIKYPENIYAKFESKDIGTQNIVFDMKNYSVKNTTAEISKAQVEIRVTNGLTAPYGYQIDSNYFDFDIYVGDVLNNTLKQEIIDNIVLEVEHNSNISTSGYINVGTYNIVSSSVLSNIDFTVTGEILINKKLLEITGIFDKIFDNTNALDISNIESVSFISEDDVKISSASYQGKEVGSHLINFTLEGEDKDNYLVPEIYGEIRTKYLTVKFDYSETDLINSGKLVGKVAQKIYDYNSNFIDLPTVSHEGYGFTGFVYTYGENQTVVVNETLKIEDYVDVSLDEITLKASYIINKYNVTLNFNSGIAEVLFEDNVSEKEFEYGSVIDLTTLQINTKDDNYEFVGYYLNTEKVDTVTVYKNTLIKCEFAKITSDIILNSNGGMFTNDQVTYLKNAGFTVSENIIATKTCQAGSKVSLSGISTSKIGYSFLGWTLENSTSTITEILWKNNGFDVNLYASFTPNKYKLYISAGQGYFDNNLTSNFVPEDYNGDGQITKIYKLVEYDNLIGEITQPIREGYEFDYWVCADSGEVFRDINSVIYQTASDRNIVAVYNQTVFNLNIGDSQGKITYSAYLNDTFKGTSKSLSIVAGENDSVKIFAVADKGYIVTNSWTVIGSEKYENSWTIENNQIIFDNLKFLTEDAYIYTTVESKTNIITLSSNDYSKGNVKSNEEITQNGFITVNAKTEEIVEFEVIALDGYEFTGKFEIIGNVNIEETNVQNVYNLTGFNEDISVQAIFTECTNNIKVIADEEKGLIFLNGDEYKEKVYLSKTNTVIDLTIKTKFGYELDFDPLKWQKASSFEKGSAIFVITYSNSGYYNVRISNFISDGTINIVYANQRFKYTVNYAIFENGNLIQNSEDFDIQIFDGENEILDNKLPYKTNIKVKVSKVKEGYHLYNVSNNKVNIDETFNTLDNLVINEDYITFDVLNVIEMTLIFEINKYEITLISNDYGNVEPSSIQIAHGSQIDFDAVLKNPNEGYEFDKFVEIIDNNEVNITDLIIKENRTFKAIFIPKSFDLSIFAGLREADKYDDAITEQELFNSLTVNVDKYNVYSTEIQEYDGRSYILTKTQTGKTITLTVNLPVGYEVDNVYTSNIKSNSSSYVTYDIVTENSVSTISIQGFTEECDIVVSFRAKLFDVEISFIKQDDLSKFTNAANISLTDTTTIDDQVSYVDGVMVVKVKYNAKLYLRANINLGYVLYDLDAEHVKANNGISVTAQDVEPYGTYAFIRDYEFVFDCTKLELNSLNKIQIYVKELVYKITFNTNIENDKVNSPVYYAKVKYGGSTLEQISSDLEFNLSQITRPTAAVQWKFMGWINPDNFGTRYLVSDGKIYSIDSSNNRMDRFYGTGTEKDYKLQESYEITLYGSWDVNYYQIKTTYIPNLAENNLINSDEIFTNPIGRMPHESNVYYISTYRVDVVVPTYKQGYTYKGYEVIFTGQSLDVVQSGTETEFFFEMPSCNVEIRFIYEIEISISANEKGLVSFDNSDYKSLDAKNYSYYGSMTEEQYINVYAKANEGYEFSHFEINGIRFTSDNSSYTLVTNADSSLATLTIKALAETLSIKAVFIGRVIPITFVRLENAWVNKVNNVSITYNDNTAIVNSFRVDDTLNFTFESVNGYKFSEFEEYGRIFEFALTKEHLEGLTFTVKSEGINVKFRITARESGVGSDAVVMTNGTKLGEIWTLTYPSSTTINFNLFERYEFVEKLTINNKNLTYNGLSFEVSTQNSSIYLDETRTNEIVIYIRKKMWMEYGEDLYKNGTMFSGDGTESRPYIIKSVEDLAIMAYLINTYENNNSTYYASSTYQLKLSINLYEKFWTPIGVKENPFNGTFIFGSFKVKDIFLTKKYPETKYDGLFGVCGENAKFITENTDFTILYFIIGGVLLLILLVIAFIILRDRLKRRKMEKQSNRSLVG